MDNSNNKAKMLYMRLSQEIHLTEATSECLKILCQAHSDYWDAVQDLKTNGRMIKSDRGWKTNPALQDKAQSFDQYLKMAKALGITKAEVAADVGDKISEFFQED